MSHIIIGYIHSPILRWEMLQLSRKTDLSDIIFWKKEIVRYYKCIAVVLEFVTVITLKNVQDTKSFI